jgi:hypothetical protein
LSNSVIVGGFEPAHPLAITGEGVVYHGPAGWKLRTMLRDNSAWGHPAANAMCTRVAVSVVRAAILIRRVRNMVNSALAKGCGLEIASRTASPQLAMLPQSRA